MVEKLDLRLTAFEDRIGLIPSSFLIGLLSLGLAMLYVAPKFEPVAHGVQFASLSNNPFDFSVSNALRFRILPVLIGHLTGLRGDRFVFVPLLFASLLLSSVYGVFRKKGFGPIDAFLVTSLITFSATISLQLYHAGYTDAVLHFFVFWSFVFVRKPAWSALAYGSALLTHESALFMLPALGIHSWYENRGNRTIVLRHGICLSIALAPLFLYRTWVTQHVDVAYDLAFYLSESNIRNTLDSVRPRFLLGLFFVFKLSWLLPALVLGKSIYEKQDLFVLLILLILVCDVAQLVFAYDITRMLCLGFPVLLISAENAREYWPDRRFTAGLLLLLLFSFLIPPFFMTQVGLVRLRPFFLQ